MGEIELWLWYFTGQSQADKSADRCLLFFVKCSLKMLLEDTVIPPLFTVLMQHIENVRIYNIAKHKQHQVTVMQFKQIYYEMSLGKTIFNICIYQLSEFQPVH